MPYHIEQHGVGYCVYKDGEAEPMRCYTDKGDADAYLTALTIATADEVKAETYTPPADVATNARMALEVRAEKPPSQRGMTPVGIARATQLSNRQPVSIDTIRRMVSYFDRHEVDKQGTTWGERGKGWQAWMGWGGDEGRTWANRILKETDMTETKETYKASRRHSEGDMKLIRAARRMASDIVKSMQDLGDDGMEMDVEPKAVKAIEMGGEFNTRQRMMVSSLVEITHDAGKFDKGIGANGAHYMPAEQNPFAAQGIACEYCFFYQPEGQCAIVDGAIEEYAICKLWVIPESVIVMETVEAVAESAIDPSETDDVMDDMETEEAEVATLQNPIDTMNTIEDESVKAFARKLIGRQ